MLNTSISIDNNMNENILRLTEEHVLRREETQAVRLVNGMHVVGKKKRE